ncbi:MAG: ACP phosphodiesterase [Nevskia sp.]|nr:ACP phosphodiesterase [Nevskia sp.]
MNYLAHLWLTEQAGLPLAGAVLGDMVHGRLDGHFPRELERSIRLHRRVDVVTDAHPLVAAARTRFGPGARRYAGIVLDVVYDHCLARDWQRYHPQSLAEFARAAATAVCAEREGFVLAGRGAPSSWRMHRLLRSYANPRGIDLAQRRTARWLKKPEGLIEAGRDWREHAAAATDDLPQLLEDLGTAARRFAEEE